MSSDSSIFPLFQGANSTITTSQQSLVIFLVRIIAQETYSKKEKYSKKKNFIFLTSAYHMTAIDLSADIDYMPYEYSYKTPVVGPRVDY